MNVTFTSIECGRGFHGAGGHRGVLRTFDQGHADSRPPSEFWRRQDRKTGFADTPHGVPMTRPKIPNLQPRVGLLPARLVASTQPRKMDDSGAFSHLYTHSRWRKLRLRQLALEPLCRMCDQLDGVVKLATICDHVEPHRGDMEKFWSGPFQSLCKPHHDSTKQAQEKSGAAPVVRVGLDGWPVREGGGGGE